MPALCVGLTYLLERAVSGPNSVDNVQVHFFYALLYCLFRRKQISQNATFIAQIWPKSKKKTTILAALS